jgi:four helix bundle protein
MNKIISHKDLKVYQLSFEVSMQIFEISKSFPPEEKYSLTDQIRRSSRSVSSNIAEAWRKRRYEKSFVAKLSDSEGEAAEAQVWLDFSLACKYINDDLYNELNAKYDHILAMLVKMIFNPQQWTLNTKK